MEEYCIIYGKSDNNPGPFVFAVSKDQLMINNFREEHYHLCAGGEVLNDNQYENYCYDYEIIYHLGHYMTQQMVTDFRQYCTSIFNRVFAITDSLHELDYLIFSDVEQEIVDEGFGLFSETLYDLVPVENISPEDDMYASILDLDICVERFLSQYQPNY